jgi:hypothetical protein
VAKTKDQKFFGELSVLLKKYGAKIGADTYRLCPLPQITIKDSTRENGEPYLDFGFDADRCSKIAEGKLI